MFGRRQKTDIDARSVLLETASRLFAKHGFEAVSTRMLAQEAGVNIAMIAYYFGSKEKLFEAIIDQKLPQAKEMLLHFLESDLEPWDKLRSVIRAYIERIFAYPSFSKLINRELSLQQRPEHNERILRGIMDNWEIMSKIIEEGQKKGVFRTDIDTIMTLSSIFGTIVQIVNTPIIAARLLQITDDKNVFSEETKNRLNIHLEKMIKAYLFVNRED
ncbi:MAG: TetR/AcrR family transcriptional regulator [Saprospiraceae bacterium]|nr:TetR/AcrR family transcriptional regulator [Saprospiraceae bacterium]